MTSNSKKLFRYAICVEDEAVLVVDAADVKEALERAHQVRHVVARATAGADIFFTARRMNADEPARVDYFRDGHFQLLSETKH